jgi:hypothetical protein
MYVYWSNRREHAMRYIRFGVGVDFGLAVLRRLLVRITSSRLETTTRISKGRIKESCGSLGGLRVEVAQQQSEQRVFEADPGRLEGLG